MTDNEGVVEGKMCAGRGLGLRLASLAVALSSGPALATGAQLVAYRSFLPSVQMTARFAEVGVDVRTFGVCNTKCGDGSRLYSDPITWTGIGQYDWTGVDAMVADLIAASPNARFIACIDLNTPEWLASRASGDSFNTLASYASDPNWIATTTVWLRECLSHLESLCGDRMVGYVLMAGLTTEWFQYLTPPAELGMSTAAFENQIYDPVAEKAKVDYWRSHNACIADALLSYAHVARTELPAAREIGAFFGYFNVCNGDWFASGGHLDYERVAASADIDFFISPATYAERGMGCGTGTMTVNGTLRRHGKRVLHEIDCRTSSFSDPLGGITKWRNAAEDVAGLTREAAFALVHGCSWWWFDLFTPSNFSNPDVLSRIGALQSLRSRYASSNLVTSADILLVCDPETALNCVKDGKLRACGDVFRNKLNRIGLAYDVCSFGDLAATDMDKYRLVCLPSTWVITPERANLLNEKVCCGGRTVLWTYAPGVSDGATLDSARVETWAGVPYGTSGLATTDRGTWKAVYAADPSAITKEQLRAVGVAAGCHAWTDDLLPVAANERLVAVHAATAGTKTVNFKSNVVEIADALTGRVVARGVQAVSVQFEGPDTRVFELRDTVSPDEGRDASAVTNVLPTAYLEYVETTGDEASGQYFDVGYTPTSRTEIELDIAYTAARATDVLFCAHGTNGTDRAFSLLGRNKGTTVNPLLGPVDLRDYQLNFAAQIKSCQYDMPQRTSGIHASLMLGERTHLRAGSAGVRQFGVVMRETTPVAESFVAGGRLMLFGYYSDGFASGCSSFASARIHRVRIFEGDACVRDLLPVQCEGQNGLWDRLGKVFYRPGLYQTSRALAAGPQIPEATTRSLRDAVRELGAEWMPQGTNPVATPTGSSYLGYAELCDGVGYVGYQTEFSQPARWLGNDSSLQSVDLGRSWTLGRLKLRSYTLYKQHITITGVNSRAPTSWRIEGIPLDSTADEWTVVDARTDVTWPGDCEYLPNEIETPPSQADCVMTFDVPAEKRMSYRALRFVPTDSWGKRNNPSDTWCYSLAEIDFRVEIVGYSLVLQENAWPVAYLQSSGGLGYVDARVRPYPNRTRMRVDVMPTDLSANTHLFGARGNPLGCDGTSCCVFNIAASGLRLDWIGTVQGASVSASAGKRYVFDCKGTSVSVTDVEAGTTKTIAAGGAKGAAQLDHSLWLLNFNNAGQAMDTTPGTPQKLFGAKIWANGVDLSADLHPYSKNGLPVLYDAVSGECLPVTAGAGTQVSCSDELATGSSDTLLVIPGEGMAVVSGIVPGVGTIAKLLPGDTVELSAPEVATVGRRSYSCAGWQLYAWNETARQWTLTDSGKGRTVKYVHPNPAVACKLVWLWRVRQGLVFMVR